MKSLDFCKQILTNPKRSNFTDRNWDKCKVVPSINIFDRYLKGHRNLLLKGTNDNGIKTEVAIRLEFNSDTDFEYFTSSTSIHDGTLLFIEENFKECVYKLCQGQSYYLPTNKPPKNRCRIVYTIGDFIMLNEYDEDGTLFVPKEKPYLRERTTILLPLKTRVEYDFIPIDGIGAIGEE